MCSKGSSNRFWADASLRRLGQRAIGFDAHHVQGIAVTDRFIFITAVQIWRPRAWIYQLDRSTYELLQQKELTEGAYIHPGGISFDGHRLWVPLAQYRPGGPTQVLALDPETLAVTHCMYVEDHLSLLASDGRGTLYGTDWNSEHFYVWEYEGKRLIDHFPSPTGVAYQDCALRARYLMCGGHKAGKGMIDVLDPRQRAMIRRFPVGQTSRGHLLTREGMSIQEDEVFLLPEDGRKSVILRFQLEEGPEALHRSMQCPL